MSQDQYAPQDPKDQYAGPEEQESSEVPHPGVTRQMDDEPDHGENSYRGSGRLQGRRAVMDYASTKAAIVAFTKALAQSLAEQGIRVNSVAPGPIWTPLIPATMPEEKVQGFGEQVPMGRAGQPAELAPAYVFFASQESSYITGETLGVTGGQPLT